MLKNKIQPSKMEELIDFIKLFVNQAAAHPAPRRARRGCAEMESFYRREAGQGSHWQKKRSFLSQDMYSLGEEKRRKRFHHAEPRSFLWNGEGPRDRSSDWGFARKSQTG